ncbi:MAG TPA: type I-U CRISPR-associated protein Csb2 [Conexibacter sp.]|nr:type I-U CRISPR-associated protein Csb2 [Conexibacter sp.]
MLGIGITYLLGRIHATPWGAHVNDDDVELAPSQFRMCRALYAVTRTNVQLHPRRAAIDAAVETLACAGPPSYRVPPSTPSHTRHYLPSRQHSPSRPGETDRVLDAFLAISPEDELQVWWDVTLDDELRDALSAAVRAVPYLGRSESLCTMRLLDEREPCEALNVVPDAAERSSGVADATTELLCVTAEAPLDVLGVDVTTMRRKRLRQPVGTLFVRYAVSPSDWEREAREPARDGPTIARFRVADSRRPSFREAVALADAMRTALQSRYGRRNGRAQSPCFSGRNGGAPRSDQHLHAHYLVTPDAEGRRADHIVVWAPEGFSSSEVEALATLGVVHHWSFESELRVALTALGTEDELGLASLLGESAHWRSLTPFALPRHPKQRGGRVVDAPEEQIAREWSRRRPDGPELTSVRLVPGDWHTFRRTRPGVARLGAPMLVGAELQFAQPVRGPIALGALSHFGLGLFEAVGA